MINFDYLSINRIMYCFIYLRNRENTRFIEVKGAQARDVVLIQKRER